MLTNRQLEYLNQLDRAYDKIKRNILNDRKEKPWRQHGGTGSDKSSDNFSDTSSLRGEDYWELLSDSDQEHNDDLLSESDLDNNIPLTAKQQFELSLIRAKLPYRRAAQISDRPPVQSARSLQPRTALPARPVESRPLSSVQRQSALPVRHVEPRPLSSVQQRTGPDVRTHQQHRSLDQSRHPSSSFSRKPCMNRDQCSIFIRYNRGKGTDKDIEHCKRFSHY